MNLFSPIRSIVNSFFFNRRTFRDARKTFAASPITDRNITQGVDWNAVYRDRYNYQRDTVLQESLLAWRLNPLARRLVTITRQYVTDDIQFHCAHEGTAKFLKELWEHPLNRMEQRLDEWCDELTLTGNLFTALTTDSAGMSYIRAYPTDSIHEIETARNDVQQETAYMPKATIDDPDPVHVLNYWAYKQRKPKTVMLHFAVNRLAGMKWGEPDLAPVLPWLARYAAWLEDRIRLNTFRQAYVYHVKGRYLNAAEKEARQAYLNAHPPRPGTVLVTDETEEWEVMAPKLDSFEANNDGLSLKKFIAAGHGVPLHWLSEPESSTRTTAEAAGTPTFKTLEERQQYFLALVKEVLTVCVARRAMRGDTSVDPTAEIEVTAGDVSERDNAALALATSQIVTAFGSLYNANLIDVDEFLRVVYRFSGEVLPGERPDKPNAKPIVGTGSDGNDGTAADRGHALLHIQTAIDLVAELDLGVYDVTIQCADSHYKYSSKVVLKQVVGSGTCTLVGDTTTPSNCPFVSSVSYDSAIESQCLTPNWTIKGFQLSSTGTSPNAISAKDNCYLAFQSLEFSSGFAYHIDAERGGIIYASGNYSVSAGASGHLLAYDGGIIRTAGRTITYSNSPAFTTYDFWSHGASVISCWGMTFTNGGTVTGTRYLCDLNGIMDTGGGGANYVPGNAAGATATGGQYA